MQFTSLHTLRQLQTLHFFGSFVCYVSAPPFHLQEDKEVLRLTLTYNNSTGKVSSTSGCRLTSLLSTKRLRCC